MNFEDEKYIIITVAGIHAGETLSSIFSRKQKEIRDNGKTYWLLKSFKAKGTQVQENRPPLIFGNILNFQHETQ